MPRLFFLLLAFVAGTAAGCGQAPAADRGKDLNGGVEGVFTAEEIWPGAWRITALKDIPPYGAFPTSSLLLARGATEAVLVDTLWTDAQTQALLRWSEAALGREVSAALLTHAHDDKMGGMGALEANGVASFAHGIANRNAPARGLRPASRTLAFGAGGRLARDSAAAAALSPAIPFYPGPGHAEGNLVAGVEGAPVLFAGCLVRPSFSRDLGNTADGSLSGWAGAVRRSAEALPDAALIVVSHGPAGGRGLLGRTEALAAAAAEGL